jgi:glyoxylate carboligase
MTEVYILAKANNIGVCIATSGLSGIDIINADAADKVLP